MKKLLLFILIGLTLLSSCDISPRDKAEYLAPPVILIAKSYYLTTNIYRDTIHVVIVSNKKRSVTIQNDYYADAIYKCYQVGDTIIKE